MKGDNSFCKLHAGPEAQLEGLSVGNMDQKPQDIMVHQESQDASAPFFLYAYDPTLPRAKDKLFKFLRYKLPQIFDFTQLSDLDIIIENGALIEGEIDRFLAAAGVNGRATIGLGGTYILTIVGRPHEAGRRSGEQMVDSTTMHVADDLANRPKDPPSHDSERSYDSVPSHESEAVEPIIESEAGPNSNVETTVIEDTAIQSDCIKEDDSDCDEPVTICQYKSAVNGLVLGTGRARNVLYCPNFNELNECIIEHTGHGAPKALLKKFENKGHAVGKEPDFSYYPFYLPALRKMQCLRAFPRMIGQVNYSDSSSKGTMDCAIQIYGSDLQPYAVYSVDVDMPPKKKGRFDTIRLSKYDCSPEFLVHLSRNCSYDEETIDALKWAALLKARREKTDLLCFKKLITARVINIEKVRELRREFTSLASENFQNKENVFEDIPHDAKELFKDIGKLRKLYSRIPKLPEILERNIQYHQRMIDELMKSLEGITVMEADKRNLLTTRAIIENANTYQIKENGDEEFTIRKLGYGQSAQEFVIPVSAVFGFFFAENEEESIYLAERRMEKIFLNLSAIPDVSAVVVLQ